MHGWLLAAAALAGAGMARAESDFQLWTAGFLSGPVASGSPLLIWFDGHARFRDDAANLGVTILRPGLGYRVNDRLSLWAGYARVEARMPGAPRVGEDRVWQQATYPIAALAGGRLSGRTRLEQRLRGTGDTGWRVRQFVRWARPIAGTDLSVIVWDELFLNLDDADWGQASGFDQNRLFAGAGWQVARPVRLEAGYMHNPIRNPNGPDRVNHNLSLTLFLAL